MEPLLLLQTSHIRWQDHSYTWGCFIIHYHDGACPTDGGSVIQGWRVGTIQSLSMIQALRKTDTSWLSVHDVDPLQSSCSILSASAPRRSCDATDDVIGQEAEKPRLSRSTSHIVITLRLKSDVIEVWSVSGWVANVRQLHGYVLPSSYALTNTHAHHEPEGQ